MFPDDFGTMEIYYYYIADFGLPLDCLQTGASRSSGAEVQTQVRHSRGVDHGQGGPATGTGFQAVSSQRTQGETSGATTAVVLRIVCFNIKRHFLK